MIDMHIHTYYSDGTLSPKEVVERAAGLGVKTIAISDHDGFDGIPEALAAGKQYGVEVIAGIEFSADIENESAREGSVHILGYGIDIQNEKLQRAVAELKEKRSIRNEALLKALRGIGYHLDSNDVLQRPEQEYVGKPNFAKAMQKKGYIKFVKDAFAPEKYLRHPAVREIRREKLSSKDAISLILEAGGQPILAHPKKIGFLKPETEGFEERLEALLLRLQKEGLSGLECHHSSHTKEEAKELEKIADRLGLTITAGSDFHGPDIDSSIEIGVTCLPPSRSSK